MGRRISSADQPDAGTKEGGTPKKGVFGSLALGGRGTDFRRCIAQVESLLYGET